MPFNASVKKMIMWIISHSDFQLVSFLMVCSALSVTTTTISVLFKEWRKLWPSSLLFELQLLDTIFSSLPHVCETSEQCQIDSNYWIQYNYVHMFFNQSEIVLIFLLHEEEQSLQNIVALTTKMGTMVWISMIIIISFLKFRKI